MNTEFELPFGINMLTVQVETRGKHAEAEKLELGVRQLANELHKELNQRLLYSATRQFNEAPLHQRLELSPTLWDFLQVALSLNVLSNNAIRPLIATKTEDGSTAGIEAASLARALEVDADSQTVVKRLPLTLDASVLLPNYIIDHIASYLHEHPQAQAFALHSSALTVSDRDIERRFAHPHTGGEYIVRSTTPIVYQSEFTEHQSLPAGFGILAPQAEVRGLLIEAENIWAAIALAAQANQATELAAIAALHGWHNCLVTLLLEDGEIKQL